MEIHLLQNAQNYLKQKSTKEVKDPSYSNQPKHNFLTLILQTYEIFQLIHQSKDDNYY